jgi:hypothetical protein
MHSRFVITQYFPHGVMASGTLADGVVQRDRTLPSEKLYQRWLWRDVRVLIASVMSDNQAHLQRIAVLPI